VKTVAIVGRPNVGKSRLFNRIIGRRHAIVDDAPGITRDRIEVVIEHDGRPVRWIDTGGIGIEGGLAAAITLQAEVAIETADVILFVTDARDGLLPLDAKIAARLRGRAPVILVVNKVDSPAMESTAAEFSALGFPEIAAVSAEHGRGASDLIERALALAGVEDEESAANPLKRIAIVGRPNVGKSSLLNAILGEERVIVAAEAGTTRDAIEAVIDIPEGRLAIVDTAGIRKKRTSMTRLESVMVGRARQSVERADVAIVVADAVEGVSDQDVRIVAATLAMGRAAVLALNKWDAIEHKKFDAIAAEVRRRLKTMAHVPIVSISALKRLRIHRLLAVALDTAKNAERRIATSRLNELLADAARRAPAGVRLKYGMQRSVLPPSFVIFGTSRPPASVARFLEKLIRVAEDFRGAPIVMEFKR
jgi:GTP-binding protein